MTTQTEEQRKALNVNIQEFDNFLNEPPENEELRKVRDYRHEAYKHWQKLYAAIEPIEVAIAANASKPIGLHAYAQGERNGTFPDMESAISLSGDVIEDMPTESPDLKAAGFHDSSKPEDEPLPAIVALRLAVNEMLNTGEKLPPKTRELVYHIKNVTGELLADKGQEEINAALTAAEIVDYKAAGFQDVGELLDAYQKLKAKVDSAEVIYQIRIVALSKGWEEVTLEDYEKCDSIGIERRTLYATPPSAQALVEIALRDAAEVARNHIRLEFIKDDRAMRICDDIAAEILALKPNPSALRDICLKVARQCVDDYGLPHIESIVDRVLGEQK